MLGPISADNDRSDRRVRRLGFTIVEILAVVAIISLLMAILIPSLSRAREQARIASCAANNKQVASILANYQTEFNNHVPVIFNYDANEVYKSTARHTWLSVALYRYSKAVGAARLPADFNPDERWDNKKRNDYQLRLLDDFWVCPFVRDKGPSDRRDSSMVIKGKQGERTYSVYEWDGWYETYHTFLWQDIIRNRVAKNDAANLHPNDPVGSANNYAAGDGRPKYTVLTFNRANTDDTEFPMRGGEQLPKSGGVPVTSLHLKHRQWSDDDAQRYRGGSLSDMTTIYCNQGTHMGLDASYRSPNSHMRSEGPGTNAAFADTHVEWVKGTQIGWP